MSKTNNLIQRLKDLYSPIHALIRKYPKAAKKHRVMKKWLKRHGEAECAWADLTYSENPLLRRLDKEDHLGVYYPIPVVFGDPNAKTE